MSDIALAQYQRALDYGRAGLKDGLRARTLVEDLAEKVYRGGGPNPYDISIPKTKVRNRQFDEIMLTHPKLDVVRDLLSQPPLSTVALSSEEKEILRLTSKLFETGKERNYGHWTRLDKCARLFFGALGIVALLAPLFALSYIKPRGFRLLASALFVAAFTIVFSSLSLASNQEVLAVSAAYAAVLVVFIGTTDTTTAAAAAAAM